MSDVDTSEEEKCIICFEEKCISNPLFEAKDIFESNCGCIYFVHKDCLNTWKNIKKKDFLCVNCNSPAKLINKAMDTDIILEIDSQPNAVDIAIERQLIIAQAQRREENLEAGCAHLKSSCCIWTLFAIIMMIIILSI